ncbi:O-antigen ligase family protein [Vicingaceae bacterium]|nr:O-antigen ligase family protein [Vicingaceae bacterium]
MGLVYPSVYLLDRFSTAMLTPYLFKKVGKGAFVALVLVNITFTVLYESSTVIVVTAGVIFIQIVRSYKVFRFLSISGFVVLIVGLVYFGDNFKRYNVAPYSVYGNTIAVSEGEPLLQLDLNSTWRAMIWYRLAVEQFPNNLIGIGFGTPLLPYIKGANSAVTDFGDHSDEHEVHVSGGHNSYLTVGVRLGLPALALLLLILRSVFFEYYKNRNKFENQPYGLIYLSFFSIALIGMVNLMLETPTLASIFWVALGLVAAINQSIISVDSESDI